MANLMKTNRFKDAGKHDRPLAYYIRRQENGNYEYLWPDCVWRNHIGAEGVNDRCLSGGFFENREDAQIMRDHARSGTLFSSVKVRRRNDCEWSHEYVYYVQNYDGLIIHADLTLRKVPNVHTYLASLSDVMDAPFAWCVSVVRCTDLINVYSERTKVEAELLPAVKAGARYLDAWDKDWYKKIDIKKLLLSDCKACVLGQLDGHYNVGRDERKLNDLDKEENVLAYGFVLRHSSTDVKYKVLTDLWKEEIYERLGARPIEVLGG